MAKESTKKVFGGLKEFFEEKGMLDPFKEFFLGSDGKFDEEDLERILSWVTDYAPIIFKFFSRRGN